MLNDNILILLKLNNILKMNKREFYKYHREDVYDMVGNPLKVKDIVVTVEPYHRKPMIGYIEHFTEEGLKISPIDKLSEYKWVRYVNPCRVLKISKETLKIYENRVIEHLKNDKK